MRRLLSILCLSLLGIINPALRGADDEDLTNNLQLPTFSLLKKTETVVFKDLPKPFVLKHLPILQSSEQVTANGVQLVRDLDYQIDYSAGTINFLKDFPAITTIRIMYQTLPFAIKRQYQRNLFQQGQPLTDRPSGIAVTQTRSEEMTEPQPSQLRVTGTQTFGISAGS